MNKIQDYVQNRKPLTAENYSNILFGETKQNNYWSPDKKIT